MSDKTAETVKAGFDLLGLLKSDPCVLALVIMFIFCVVGLILVVWSFNRLESRRLNSWVKIQTAQKSH